jgi:hypothetical protein
MSAYALAMLVAWGFDSGWAAVGSLAPAFGRGLLAAGVAAVVASPLVSALIGDGPITVWSGLGVGLVGGVTTLAAFLGVSLLIRSPEIREVFGR